MRALKFRAWFPKDHWVTGEQRMVTDYTDLKIFEDFGFYTEEIKYMQFTGKTDKNGKEIYEGDLVKDFRGELHKVKYNEFCSFMIYPLSDESKFLAIYPGIDLEIVGNIYQNPELL